MAKRNKLIYWATTGFLAFGMLAQGLAQLVHTKGYVDILAHLGYPVYFLSIIGGWKLLGVAAILMPRFGLVKEWAYAGFFFVMSGAVLSHVASGDSGKELAPALFLLILTVASWYFRPAERRVATITPGMP